MQSGMEGEKSSPNFHIMEKFTGRFAEKIVLITGGSTGIGRASALAFAREGASVVVADIATDAARQTVALVEELGARACFVQADVRHAADAEQCVQQAVERFGGLHIALNNAGIEGSNDKATHDYDAEQFRTVLDVNVMGVLHGMQAQLRYWLQHKQQGCIVNTASIAGLNGFAFHAGYAASKFAVVGLTKTAALEYARKGIRINAVCPGFTQTPMLEESIKAHPELSERTFAAIPMRRLGTPDDIAGTILFLCSPDAAYITGHTQVIDGGLCAM
jgi:3-oxoacyl-[acyl-carrier protein] reductase